MAYGYIDTLRLLNITLTPDQHIAFTFLESRGYRFLVHFGLNNAVTMADSMLHQVVM